MPGLNKITKCGLGITASTTSPIPETIAAQLASSSCGKPFSSSALRYAFIIIEKGTSAPILAPASMSSLIDKGLPSRWFTPSITAAAFPLPPAIPAATGSFLSISIEMHSASLSFSKLARLHRLEIASMTVIAPFTAKLSVVNGIFLFVDDKYMLVSAKKQL